MSQLPLQIRKDVRDVFDKDSSAVQTAFKKLAEVVGHSVSCDVEWPMLWTELEPIYPDKTTFVPSLANVLEIWSETLANRLEDDRYSDWTEVFLERIEPARTIRIVLQVSDESRPKTAWSDKKPAFTISLPRKTPSHGASAASGFATDFDAIFNAAASTGQPEQSQAISKEDDDWADVESIAESRVVSSRTRAPDFAGQQPDLLPSLQTLPRPDILFRTITPYLMQVTSFGASKVTISGTHEPSLRLLAEYLQRWIKQDPQDVRKIPYLRVKLNESNFGSGLYYDSVTIEPFDHHQRNASVNVVMILAFIQGVLGYESISETSGAGYWEFKRMTPFKG